MEANTGNRASPHWGALYEATLLEVDVEKLPQRIPQARNSITDRVKGLNHSCDNSESQAWMNAPNVLRHLLKKPDADGKAQNYRDSDKLPVRAGWSQTHVLTK